MRMPSPLLRLALLMGFLLISHGYSVLPGSSSKRWHGGSINKQGIADDNNSNGVICSTTTRADFLRQSAGAAAAAFLMAGLSFPSTAFAATSTDDRIQAGLNSLSKEAKKMDKTIQKETKKLNKEIKKDIKKADRTLTKEKKKITKEIKKVDRKVTKETKKVLREVDKGTEAARREATKVGDAVDRKTKEVVDKALPSSQSKSSSSGIDVSKLKVCDGVKVKCL